MSLVDDIAKYLDEAEDKNELASWQKDKIRKIEKNISKDSDRDEVLREIESVIKRNHFYLSHFKDKSAMKDILKRNM